IQPSITSSATATTTDASFTGCSSRRATDSRAFAGTSSNSGRHCSPLRPRFELDYEVARGLAAPRAGQQLREFADPDLGQPDQHRWEPVVVRFREDLRGIRAEQRGFLAGISYSHGQHVGSWDASPLRIPPFVPGPCERLLLSLPGYGKGESIVCLGRVG